MPWPAQRGRLPRPRQLKSGSAPHKKYQAPKGGVVATIAAMSTATHPALAPLVELVRSASAQRTPLRVRGGDTKAFHGSPAHGLPVLDTRDLSGVVASITEGVVKYTQNVADLHRSMDAEIANAVGKLGGAIQNLDDTIDDLNDSMESFKDKG